MYCKKCGNQIEQGAAFCKKCGTPVEKAQGAKAGGMGNGTALASAQYLRIGMAAASLLVVLGSVLPWLAFNSDIARYTGMKSMSLLNAGGKMGDGIIFIVIAVVSLVFLYLKKNIPVLVCGIASFAMYCFELSQINNLDIQVLGTSVDIFDFVSRGAGFYVMSVAAVASLALSVLLFMQDRKQKK